MVGCSTGDDHNLFYIFQGLRINSHLLQEHLPRIKGGPPLQSVSHDLRLFENLFEHEVFETALFDHERAPREPLHFFF